MLPHSFRQAWLLVAVLVTSSVLSGCYARWAHMSELSKLSHVSLYAATMAPGNFRDLSANVLHHEQPA